MNFRSKSKKTGPARPRIRQNAHPVAKIPSTISYSDTNRIIRTDTNNNPGQGRDRNIRQIETINEDDGHRAKRWLSITGLILLLIVVILGLSISSRANIDIVQPEGFNYLPHSLLQYQNAASAAIDSSLFNRFKPTVSSNDIAAYLEQRYPEIAYAAVTVPLVGFTPTLHIQLSQPVLIYAIANSNSYLVNAKGFIIADATSVRASAIKGLIQINSLNSIAIGGDDQVLTPDNVAFIETVKQALTLKGISISRMNLVPMAEELDVYPLGTTYFIKFNLHQSDSLTQVGAYLATIATLKQQNITPSQYVDVRLDGRAYYK